MVSGITGALCLSMVQAAEPQGVQAGPGRLFPVASLNVYYDDNLLSQPRDEVDSLVTVASLGAREEFDGEASRFAVEGGLANGWYHSSSDDNYLDGYLVGEAGFFPTRRISTSVTGGYWRQHEDRGTTSLQGEAASEQDEPDVYDQWSIEGEFGYGLEEVGAAKFELLAGYLARDYVNNRPLTRARDRHEATLGGTFRYMVMPATSLLVEGRAKDFNYDQDENRLDSREYRVLAGVTWEATASTTGFAKLGWQKKTFDSDQRDDDDKPAWEIGVDWSPLSYSTFGLSTDRQFDESTGTGDFVDKRSTQLTWRHAWRDFLTSNLFVSAGRDDYPGSTREDDLSSLGFSLDYSMREYLDWQFYFNHTERDSNVEGLDYIRNKVGLQVSFSL